MRLEDLSRDEITVLYRDWMKTFSQSGRPSAKLSVSSISDNEANEKVNEIVRKATNLDFDLRYQNVSEVLEDVRSIHL